MPKALPPGLVDLPGGEQFAVAVQPDMFDERDLDYRPRLQPIPAIGNPPKDPYVLTQEGNSCTGHALAAMINAVLAKEQPPARVSPNMLYRMARRYDEFEGEGDLGSSLRGSLKGWFYHGVLPESAWPALAEDEEPDLDEDDALAAEALRRPLGAFYRVNAYRLDDMQSAVNELGAIVASAAVHDGWVEPTCFELDGEKQYVIERPVNARPLGGHAFAIVGYDDVGFLVQNSWGADWGNGGFATLPYDDWLQSAYDVWVARPGVPALTSSRANRDIVRGTAGGLVAGPGPDLTRLRRYVVNLGNQGTLSRTGRFVSTPLQVHRLVERMGEYHEFWRDNATGGRTSPRRVLIYAHGGLTSENSGLAVAARQLNWWLNNRVYPVSFAWQSGPTETLMDQIADSFRLRLPFGGIGFDLMEQFDRFVESAARRTFRWAWTEMKENARRACDPLGQQVRWPRSPGEPVRGVTDATPGASLFVSRLAEYARSLPAGESLEVHLVGHSAGSIFLTGLLPRLQEAGVPVSSLIFLAPALRTDEFNRDVLPHLRSRQVQRFASFGLDQRRELDDVCGARGVNVYHKSVLYLVSRAFEDAESGQGRSSGEVPLVGMQRFVGTDVGGRTLTASMSEVSGDLVWAHSDRPATSRSAADSHVGMDNDGPTMSSVVLRVLGLSRPAAGTDYEPHAALTGPQPHTRADAPDGAQPVVAAVEDAGDVPLARMAQDQPDTPTAPEARYGPSPEGRVAPETHSPVRDVLLRRGFQVSPR